MKKIRRFLFTNYKGEKLSIPALILNIIFGLVLIGILFIMF